MTVLLYLTAAGRHQDLMMWLAFCDLQHIYLSQNLVSQNVYLYHSKVHRCSDQHDEFNQKNSKCIMNTYLALESYHRALKESLYDNFIRY